MPSPKQPPFEADYLHSIFRYNKFSGELIWKTKSDVPPKWNGRFAGKPAGVKSHDHIVVCINYIKYGAHNIIWYMMTNEWPKSEIDHKDQNGSNNRWSNLRESTHRENMCNLKLRLDNTSGYKGISWNKYHNAWRVRVHQHGKEKLVGYFKELDSAIAARKAAAQDSYGEFYSG